MNMSVIHLLTAPPKACTELKVISSGSTTATLQWKKPEKAENFWYTLKRSDQTDIGTFTTFLERLNDDGSEVTYTVRGLKPFTSYVMRVVVQNRVTSLESVILNENRRRCDIKLTTGEGGMLAVHDTCINTVYMMLILFLHMFSS